MPARIALLGLDAQEESVWRAVATQQSVEVIRVVTSGECVAYTGLNAPLVIVARTGPTFEPSLADLSDPILGSVPLVVVCREAREQSFWSAVAWDALLEPAEGRDADLALDLAVRESRQRLLDIRLVAAFSCRHASLNSNELPVYGAVCAGRLNKQIASELNVSVRTVEQRRRRVFEKMGVESAVPLAAMAATVRTLASLARRCRRQANSSETFGDDDSGGGPSRATAPHLVGRVAPTSEPYGA